MPDPDPRFASALSSCFESVFAAQAKDGGFEGETIFHPALILSALSAFKEDPTVKKIGKKAVRFLLEEKRVRHAWNYWKKGVHKFPPNDLDDTSAAFAALSHFAPGAVSGGALADFTKTLVQAELAPGGPYSTWIVSAEVKDRWIDKDIIVNANIAYLLSLYDIRLPNLDAFAEECIKRGEFDSKYYRSKVAALYFISRFYRGKAQAAARKLILAERGPDGLWESDLMTALAVSALINFGGSARAQAEAVARLMRVAERKEFKHDRLYIEEIVSGKPVWSGSSALTAAFAAEAIGAFSRAETSPRTPAEARPRDDARAHAVRQAIVRRVKARSGSLLAETRERAGAMIGKLVERDPSDQIALLPYIFALGAEMPDAEALGTELGVLNLSGWLAYRIYDDLLDREGEASDMPLANLLLRDIVRGYERAFPAEFRPFLHEVMDGIERANAWEAAHARASIKDGFVRFEALPEYGKFAVLAEKSLGHALGPVAVLARKGFGPESVEVRTVLSFFKHYLIARQLNDDAHDWYADLGRGYLNSASADVLRRFGGKAFSLLESKERLQGIFWRESISHVIRLIRKELLAARKDLRKMSSFQNDAEYLESLLAPLGLAADKAEKDQGDMLDFLASY